MSTQLGVGVEVGDGGGRLLLAHRGLVDQREPQLAAADDELVLVAELVLAPLLAVDHDLLLPLQGLDRVGLAVEVDAGVGVGQQRVGQDHVVVGPVADRRDLLIEVVDRRRLARGGESQ
jgi:hypothetical protein